VTLAFGLHGRELSPEANSLFASSIVMVPVQSQVLPLRIPSLVGRADVVHVHGLWSLVVATAGCASMALRKPLVVSPRGMLEPWALAHRGWKKALALKAGFRRILERAQLLHATAESEAGNLRALGLTGPIAVVPNAVRVPDYRESAAGAQGNHALFLSRIHPKKGLVELVRAFAQLRQEVERGSWRITIAGSDPDGYWPTVASEVERCRMGEFIRFVGHVDGQEKWDLYRSASFFVLPTYSENFGLVIAEALACGVPCVTTQGAPWAELATRDCGWWCPVGQEALQESLREALRTPVERLRSMGVHGIELVRDHYSVDAQGALWREVYRWIAHGARRPECVHVMEC